MSPPAPDRIACPACGRDGVRKLAEHPQDGATVMWCDACGMMGAMYPEGAVPEAAA